MNRFNRDYALVRHDGFIMAESHDLQKLERYREEFIAEGVVCEVIKSDLPRSRAA